MMDNLLDILLGTLVFLLAWRALSAGQLYQSAIVFIAFGLSMALAWTRLAAPDVALAEAAIGAGLLGVLLIDSLKVFESKRSQVEKDRRQEAGADPLTTRSSRNFQRFGSVLVVFSCLVLAGVLFFGVVWMPDGGGLTAIAAAELHRSGVEHPVTAVLLNYRSYDTWLEIGVLMLAMFAIFCTGRTVDFHGEPGLKAPSYLVNWLVRFLVPVMILAAGYLLWLGKFAPGGAFQSGVVLGAAGILLHLAGFRTVGVLPETAWKLGLLAGFGLFLIFGLLALLGGNAFLEYPERWAGELILLVETAAAISIGFTLTCIYVFLSLPHPLHGLKETEQQSI